MNHGTNSFLSNSYQLCLFFSVLEERNELNAKYLDLQRELNLLSKNHSQIVKNVTTSEKQLEDLISRVS